MSIDSTPSSSSHGRLLSCNVTTVFAVLAAMTFSASGAAPTPLYQEYQSHFGLTPFMITVIFATYVLSLLLALLTVGSLSDFLGRRPAILSALGMNIVAMLLFMMAGSAGATILDVVTASPVAKPWTARATIRAVHGSVSMTLYSLSRTLTRWTICKLIV